MDIVLPRSPDTIMGMGWFAYSTLLIAGFSLAVGVSHFLDWFYYKRDKDSLAFSFLCFAVASHAIALVFLYRSETVEGYGLALKLDLCALFVAQWALVSFVTLHMRLHDRWAILLFGIVFVILLVANLLSPASLLTTEIRHLIILALSGKERFVTAEFDVGPWGPWCLLATITTYVYCLVACIRGRQNVEQGEALAMAVSLIGLLGIWVSRTLIEATVSSFVVLSHYAFLGFILLMGSALSSRYGRQALFLAQTHEALQESEERFRKLVENAPDAIVVYDLTLDRFIDANPHAELLFGCSRNELLQSGVERFQVLWPSGDPAQPVEDIHMLAEQAFSGKELDVERIFRNMAGKELTCEVRLVSLPSEGRRLIRASLLDITERKLAEKRQLEYQQRLRLLASELALTEERERKRIAIYLHDQIAQELLAARLKLEEVTSAVELGGVEQRLNEIRKLLDCAVEDTYSLTFELSLPILYELGLIPAIEWLGEKVCEANGIRFKLLDDGHPKPLGNDLRGVCFYVIRELLLNVQKHARAQQVIVKTRVEEQRLRIIVEDDGVGFDMTAKTGGFRKEGGFGMFGVRERLEYLSGTMDVESTPGKGTRITLSAPLELTEPDREQEPHEDPNPVG